MGIGPLLGRALYKVRCYDIYSLIALRPNIAYYVNNPSLKEEACSRQKPTC